ncbi:MAG TPA: hypothetical protein VFN23_02465 [Ktedonobacteraceae bacterium]|nr:hypothetical protein [Ktedonobacteraceae bacterium]
MNGKIVWSKSLYDVAVDLQVDSVNHRVYVQSTRFDRASGVLTVLDDKTGTILDSQTHTGNAEEGIALDTQRQRVYVSDNERGHIDVFTLSTSANPTLHSLPSIDAPNHPQGLGVNSRLGRLYVADSETSAVSVYDEDNGHKVATIQVATQPLPPLLVDESTGHVYVACGEGNELDVIDGNKNTILAHIPVAPDPEGVALSHATNRIYVGNEGTSNKQGTTITIINAQNFQVLGALQVGQEPDGVAVDSDLRRAYIAAEESNAVVEISDSVEITLHDTVGTYQASSARKVIDFLQRATIITLLFMLATIVVATLVALSPRWRARETLQTRQDDALSH